MIPLGINNPASFPQSIDAFFSKTEIRKKKQINFNILSFEKNLFTRRIADITKSCGYNYYGLQTAAHGYRT